MQRNRPVDAAVRRPVQRSGKRRPSPKKASFGARLLHEAIPLLPAAVIGAGLIFHGFNTIAGKAVCCFLAALCLVALVLTRWPEKAFWWRLGPVLLLTGLALVWVILPGGQAIPVFHTLAPDLFWPAFLGIVAGFCALVSGCLLARDGDQTRKFIRIIVFVVGLTFLFGLVLRELGAGGVFDYWAVMRRGRFAGTLGNINVTAAVAGGVVLLVAGLEADVLNRLKRASGRERQRRIFLTLGLMIMGALAFGTLLLTAARFPVVVLGAIAIAGVAWTLLRGRLRQRNAALSVFWGLMLAVVLVVANAHLLVERFTSLDSEMAVRLMMWRHYFGLAVDAPLFGYGPGAFSVLNLQRLDTPELALSLWSVNSPHNVLLQLALAGGVPYVLMLLAAAALVGRDVLPYLLSGRASYSDFGLAAFVVQILICSMVDIAMDVPAVTCMTLFLAGCLWGRSLCSRPLAIAAQLAPVADHRPVGG